MSNINKIERRIKSIQQWILNAKTEILLLRDELRLAEDITAYEKETRFRKKYGDVWETIHSLEGDVEILSWELRKLRARSTP